MWPGIFLQRLGTSDGLGGGLAARLVVQLVAVAEGGLQGVLQKGGELRRKEGKDGGQARLERPKEGEGQGTTTVIPRGLLFA